MMKSFIESDTPIYSYLEKSKSEKCGFETKFDQVNTRNLDK
ncbi:hypothetical protein OKW24_003901 [Peribacillus simplex]|nr:hypothetical protein [Peribacillus simplex]